ncbi:MAG: AgmX/PglI C-terminal domain-containing protein [Myxococcota bacterium]
MSSKPSQKILRIGVIQNGKIVEEKLVRQSKTVRIGSDFGRKNELVVPASGLPKSFKLFEFKDGKYSLRFKSDWTGRVSLGDRVGTLSELVSKGQAKRQGDEAVIQLSPVSRGKVKFGEVTILFQFVTPPPPKPKPVLPASMRGGWVKGVEPILIMMIALSAIIQISAVVWLENTDFPELEQDEMMVEDRFVRIMDRQEDEEKPEPDEPEQTDGEGEATDSEDKTAEKEPEKKPEPEKPDKPKKEMTAEERAAAEAEKRRRMTENVRNKTIVGQLGALSDGSDGIANQFEDGAGTTSMDQAFDGAEGVDANAAGEKDGISGGAADADGTGASAGIGDLEGGKGAKKAETAEASTGQKEEKTVKANIRGEEQKSVGMGTLDAGSISSVIRRRQSAIQNCYERVLKTNPEAGGKLVLRFTIGTRGRVTSTKVLSDISGGSVGGCASRAVKRWRFPRPKGGEVTVSKTFVLEASQ